MDKSRKEELWVEARRRCRLSAEALAMAKEMDLNPLSLIKNIPSKQEPWKAPVEDWIHDMYAKRQKKAARRRELKAAVLVGVDAVDLRRIDED